MLICERLLYESGSVCWISKLTLSDMIQGQLIELSGQIEFNGIYNVLKDEHLSI